ncbi:MAG: hypothetical protein WC052_05060 [Patescibacteria group bacterium]|jgi:hypothetical protein
MKSLHLLLASIIRYGHMVLMLLLVAVFVALSWFLYLYVYQPLTQATLVAELQSSVTRISIDRRLLRQVLETLDKERLTTLEIQTSRNPFVSTPLPAIETPAAPTEPPSTTTTP